MALRIIKNSNSAAVSNLVRWHQLHDSGPLVTILVGPEKVKFVASRDLLVRHSKYFERAFLGPFEEAESQTLALEDGVEAFEHLIQFLYTGSTSFSLRDTEVLYMYAAVPFKSFQEREELRKQLEYNHEQNVHDTVVARFLDFCVLANKLDVQCTEAVIDGVWRHIVGHHRTIQPRDIRYAWGSLPAKHAARNLLAKATFPDFFNGIMTNQNQFASELREVDGYAADVLEAYSAQVRAYNSHELLAYPDPRTGALSCYNRRFDDSDGESSGGHGSNSGW